MIASCSSERGGEVEGADEEGRKVAGMCVVGAKVDGRFIR